jgi:hypothetical protein
MPTDGNALIDFIGATFRSSPRGCRRLDERTRRFDERHPDGLDAVGDRP